MKDERPLPMVVGLGELIWDLLPEGRQLGGAPTNFAYISRLLGNEAAVASRVGRDELGREALARLARMGINTGYIQLDGTHPTGTVRVSVNERGEALFAMNENSAWDYLEWSEGWERLAGVCDAVCFGTLGQRRPRAREVILRFLAATRADALRVFDVNLRHSFFTPAMLKESLAAATVVKLSSEEMASVASMLGLSERGEEALARRLMALFPAELVAVTRGAGGSLLVTAEEAVAHEGFRVRVRDTIGAGDAFTAALVHLHLRRAPLAAMSEAANRAGAWVATQPGATPEADPRVLEEIFGDLSDTFTFG